MNELQGRVRYVRDGRSLISGRTYNELARLLRNLSSETIQISVGPNGGLKLEVGSFGAASSGGGGGGVVAYSGPFALAASGSGLVVAPGIVYAGLTSIAVLGGTVAGPYAVLTITSSGGSYQVSLGSSRSGSPSQASGSYKVVLGRLVSGVVVQWQYGNVYVAGRVV